MTLLGEVAGEAATAAAGGPLALVAKHWKAALLGAIGLAAAIALAIAFGNARHWHKIADRNHDLLIGEQMAHAVTTRSLAGAMAQIEDNNRRIRADAARLEADTRQAAADEARTAERWRGTQATITALEADARHTDRKPCTISDEARRALEDL